MRRQRGKAVEMMDYVRHFGEEITAFEAAAQKAAGADTAPPVPSCPGWTMTDLILHAGMVHRLAARVIGERLQQAPGADPAEDGLPGDWASWLPPGRAPEGTGVPAALLDWFHEGAEALEERLFLASPDEPVWSWAEERTVGFWQRTQAIEAAVHRWDAQKVAVDAAVIDSSLATDAVRQALEVLIPLRRAGAKAAPGQGEHFRFRRTDGPQSWTVRFRGDAVLLGPSGDDCDIEIAGRASDLALFLWKRPVTGQLDILGDTRMLRRYFELVPPPDGPGRCPSLDRAGSGLNRTRRT
jgi:uncharacterized protein (TIGR03083 family)